MPTRRELLFNIVSPISQLLSSIELGGSSWRARHMFAASCLVPNSLVSVEPEIITESHCLSQESTNGFRLLLSRNTAIFGGPSPRLIIIPGARQLSREAGLKLLQKVNRGTWLILESGLPFMPPEESVGQIRVLRDVFGLRVQAPHANGGAYIEYVWPLRRLLRDFSMITSVECSADEKIAEFGGMAVCAKRRMGNGGVIFLGSMLGPGLLAQEREAHELGSAILQAVRKL